MVANSVDAVLPDPLYHSMEIQEKSTKRKFVSKKWLTLAAIGIVHFSGSLCISLQAPFYPQEAESKGATATEYGLVFGSFELVSFLSSPFLGRYVHFLGVKLTLVLGLALAAFASIAFGLLHLIVDHTLFIGLSFAVRMTEAFGSTAALVASFSIIAASFPDSVATTFATLEIFYGLGYIVGPTLGGLLFSWGGYILPFAFMGAMMLTGDVFVFCALPRIGNTAQQSSPVRLKDLLKVGGVVLDCVCVSATSMSMGFLAATLEPHIRIFGLSPVANGLIFIISAGTYAISAPFVGRICDKWIYPKRCLSFGALLIVASYILIGPAPFLGIPKTLAVAIIGLIIHGLGIGFLMVPTFIDAICSAVAAGFGDDIDTYSVVSGVWSSSFALGAFIGPSVSGYLYDAVGFQYGTFFIISIHIAVFIGTTTFIALEKNKKISPKRVRLLSQRQTDEQTEDVYKTNSRLNSRYKNYGTNGIS